jgi:hypothetical protein
LNGPEFEDYYTFVGYQIQNDQYFTTLVSNVWRIPEKQDKFDRKSRQGESKSRHDPELVKQQIAAFFPRFRQRLAARGPRGFAGLTKQLFAADTQKKGLIKNIIFFRVLKEFKVDISDQDQKTIIAYYDPEETSELAYQEVIRDIVGGISDTRAEFADVAWRNLDKKNAGVVHVDDLVPF